MVLSLTFGRAATSVNKQVTRGRNIVAHEWAGAHPHHQLTPHRYLRFAISHFSTRAGWTEERMHWQILFKYRVARPRLRNDSTTGHLFRFYSCFCVRVQVFSLLLIGTTRAHYKLVKKLNKRAGLYFPSLPSAPSFLEYGRKRYCPRTMFLLPRRPPLPWRIPRDGECRVIISTNTKAKWWPNLNIFETLSTLTRPTISTVIKARIITAIITTAKWMASRDYPTRWD